MQTNGIHVSYAICHFKLHMLPMPKYARNDYEAHKMKDKLASLGVTAFSFGGDSRDTAIRVSFFRRLKYTEICALAGLDSFPPYIEAEKLIRSPTHL